MQWLLLLVAVELGLGHGIIRIELVVVFDEKSNRNPSNPKSGRQVNSTPRRPLEPEWNS